MLVPVLKIRPISQFFDFQLSVSERETTTTIPQKRCKHSIYVTVGELCVRDERAFTQKYSETDWAAEKTTAYLYLIFFLLFTVLHGLVFAAGVFNTSKEMSVLMNPMNVMAIQL